MRKAPNEIRLAHYAFWSIADPPSVMTALAWRRDAPLKSSGCVYIAGTATCVTAGVASPTTLTQLPNFFARYSPPPAPEILVRFADRCPDELAMRIHDLFRPARMGGSWYRREGLVDAWLDAVLAHPSPPYEPAMPVFSPEERWAPPANAYQRRMQRAEALATYRQALEGPRLVERPPEPVPEPVPEPAQAPAWSPGEPAPIPQRNALIPTAKPPDDA